MDCTLSDAHALMASVNFKSKDWILAPALQQPSCVSLAHDSISLYLCFVRLDEYQWPLQLKIRGS